MKITVYTVHPNRQDGMFTGAFEFDSKSFLNKEDAEVYMMKHIDAASDAAYDLELIETTIDLADIPLEDYLKGQ